MMNRRNTLGATAAFAMLMVASPVHAQPGTDKTPPGNPCGSGPGTGTGNPCNGNNGNPGQQGNVNRASPPIIIEMPAVSSRAVFVDQIGDGNRAGVEQTAPNAFTRIEQTGNRNLAGLTQRGSATSYLKATQTGDDNALSVDQGGVGQNVLFTTQTGNRNVALLSQNSTAGIHNGAVLTQVGDENITTLEQNGSDNLAVLSQEGDRNEMGVVQNGVGNRLTWTQEGNGNRNLGIEQSGSQSMLITQSRPGN